MKLALINGSPKGESSITLQYWKYLELKIEDLEIQEFPVSKSIHKWEKDKEAFTTILDSMKSCDGVVWAFPVYYMLLPSQLHRFIELVEERNMSKTFQGKGCAIFCTSIHYMDHMAAPYLEEVSSRWNMSCLESFSCEMKDLFLTEGKEKLTQFAEIFLEKLRDKHWNPLESFQTSKVLSTSTLDPCSWETGETLSLEGKKMLIISYRDEKNVTLNAMVDSVKASLEGEVNEINLKTHPLKSGCIGCIACGFDGDCRLKDLDDFQRIHQEELMTSDFLIYALPVSHGFLPAKWKEFIDRQFYRNHTPSQRGMQRGFLLSGVENASSILSEYLKIECQAQGANLVGWVSDREGCSIQDSIQSLLRNMLKQSQRNYVKPLDFTGVGGRKIFRDAIFADLRFPFVNDYKYYKKEGYFDFPQKEKKSIRTNRFIGLLARNPKIRRQIYYRDMIGHMVNPFREIIKKEFSKIPG